MELADVCVRVGRKTIGNQRGTRGMARSNANNHFHFVSKRWLFNVDCLLIDLFDLIEIHASLGPSLWHPPLHAPVRVLSRGRQEEDLDEAGRRSRCKETGRFL
jgi:hypothetical protein